MSGITAISGEGDSAIYYDLTGTRLPQAPVSGMYIKVADGKARKVIR